jgi:hypothetical protein
MIFSVMQSNFAESRTLRIKTKVNFTPKMNALSKHRLGMLSRSFKMTEMERIGEIPGQLVESKLL